MNFILDNLKEILFILSLLVSVFILASVLTKRRLAKPISDLAQSLKKLSKGDFDVGLDEKTKEELSEIYVIFNEMVAKLKDQRERELFVAKLKTEFISIAAHQLRTPLSSVKWILGMILDGDLGKLGPKQMDFLKKGYTANERMIHLVNDLLDVSRIEEGRFGFEFTRSDLNELVINIVDSFGGQATVKNVKLKYDIVNHPLPLVFDASRLRMALSNLVDNAIRYTRPGGSVVVSVVPKNDVVEMSVSDTGIGIPQKQKHRVFSKFFRADNVVKLQTEGTGLGLYLVKNIVEKHGGKIWFESEEDKGLPAGRHGTTFYFTLPFDGKI